MTLIIILALAGIVLICLELILPGMILGLAGIIALVSAVMLSFSSVELEPLGLSGRALVAASILFVSMLVIGIWLKYFDRVPIGRGLILTQENREKVAGQKPSEYIGLQGTALTDLRPAGKVNIKGLPKTCDIIAETGFIESGSGIEIIKADGRRIIVRKIASLS
jgi:membrane-bound serine protease (ClpP class)